MLDPLQFYCRFLCNGMKTRFRMVMIAHPGPGIGFHKRFMWGIIIPPTPCISKSGNIDRNDTNPPRCAYMSIHCFTFEILGPLLDFRLGLLHSITLADSSVFLTILLKPMKKGYIMGN